MEANPVQRTPKSLWMILTIVGLATAVGYLVGNRQSSADPEPTPLLAAGAASTDTMAVASGPISEDAEGVFFLDFITGDLQCIFVGGRG